MREDSEMAIELDRTQTGAVKINAVSLTNLIALLVMLGGLFVTYGAWVSRIDIMGSRVEAVTSEISSIRSDIRASLSQRDADIRELRTKTEGVSNRLSVVETVGASTAKAIERIELKIDKALVTPIPRQ